MMLDKIWTLFLRLCWRRLWSLDSFKFSTQEFIFIVNFWTVLTSFAHTLYFHVLAQNSFSIIEKVGANQLNGLRLLCRWLFALLLFHSLAFTSQFEVPVSWPITSVILPSSLNELPVGAWECGSRTGHHKERPMHFFSICPHPASVFYSSP